MKYLIAILLILPLVTGYLLHQSIYQCEGVDGHWGEWENWQPCSVTCESGFQKRYRHCDSPRPLYNGKQCRGNNSQTRQCESGRECPQDGRWSEWKVGKCSVTCGNGKRVDKRFCYSLLPKHCGKCRGEVKRVRDCIMPPCKDDIPFPFDDCITCSKKGNGMLPCRAHTSACQGKKFGFRQMYPANKHYFLHCSTDGPWCKPCASKTLVYNAKCGQCEKTRYGQCTESQNWVRELEDEELW